MRRLLLLACALLPLCSALPVSGCTVSVDPVPTSRDGNGRDGGGGGGGSSM